MASCFCRCRTCTRRFNGGKFTFYLFTYIVCLWSKYSDDQVRDYPIVLQEIGRVLRPGGLFLSCEWVRSPNFHPTFSINLPSHVPGACQFYDALARALDICRGIQPIASRIPLFLNSSELFANITTSCYHMPIGPWHDNPSMKMLGRAFRASLLRYTDSVRPLFQEAGYSEAEIDDITGAYIHELKTVRGMVGTFHTVHARRL
jgi:SAM-dependent methyltransferase